jgi:ABC-type Fe3+ transport system permease subunit
MALPDRRVDDRDLAVDRLQRAHLPGRDAGDQRGPLRGAGRWAQFRHVTLPGLRPTILFTIVVSTIGAAQLFGEPLLYHNGLPDGGTQGQYQTLGLLMYQQGWTNDRLGLASATAWTMFLIIVVAVSANLVLARRRERREGHRVPVVPGPREVVAP